MRFRKSIKICKGVRINFSKSGISTTVGGKGVSMSLGGRGAYLNTSIPGTGLYNRTRIGGGTSTKTSTNSYPSTVSQTINLKLDDNGNITFYDEFGRQINDPSLIRKVKSTPAFKAERERMMKERFEKISGENEPFVNIHQQASDVYSAEEYVDKFKKLAPKKYVPKTYRGSKPTENHVMALLQKEALNNVKTWKFWRVAKERNLYVEKNLRLRLDEEIKKWAEAKERFDKQQEILAQAENKKYLSEYNETKEKMQKLIEGNDQYIETEIEKWLSSVELPVEFNLQLEYCEGTLLVDLDLPEIEDLPQEKAVMLANGTTKKKPKTKKELKEDYINCVFGLAIFFCSHLFNVSPCIKQIVMSAYTQRSSSKAMDPEDEYVYSIKFVREVFEKKPMKSIMTPLSFCLEFENRCDITSTLILKKIVPFGIEENER